MVLGTWLLYHPYTSANTAVTIGGTIDSGATRVGMFLSSNQSETVSIAAQIGECIDVCSYAFFTHYDRYGYTSNYYYDSESCSVFNNRKSGDGRGKMCPNNYYALLDGQVYVQIEERQACCYIGHRSAGNCPKGWGNYHVSSSSSTSAGSCVRYGRRMSVIPAYSGPSPYIGSAALSSMEL